MEDLLQTSAIIVLVVMIIAVYAVYAYSGKRSEVSSEPDDEMALEDRALILRRLQFFQARLWTITLIGFFGVVGAVALRVRHGSPVWGGVLAFAAVGFSLAISVQLTIAVVRRGGDAR